MLTSRIRGHGRRISVGAVVVGLVFAGIGLSDIQPASADQAITTAGPLTNIAISSNLNCAVNHTGDSSGEFFGNTACATEIRVGATTYGPSSIPAGNSPGGFTPVSQSAITGSGTSGDPFKIVTVVSVGSTGLQITETDTYVTGQESYRTDVTVSNTTGAAIAATLYRGGDCFLQNSDSGFGLAGSPTGAIACVAPSTTDASMPGQRIEQWLPLTSGSHFYESVYSNVWAAMSGGNAFPDTCDCATSEDNGAGLSWMIAVPASGAVTESQLTTFSPVGNLPLSTTKTADVGTVNAGAQDGYTITISNPNPAAVSLSTITDTLPSGFSYNTGSTTLATTSNPTVSGQTLTWSGPLTVPGESSGTAGTLSLHFTVTISSSDSGTYMNNAGATSDSFTVAPTGDTAPVVVNAVVGPSSTTTTSTSTTSTSTTSTTSTTTTSPPTSSTTTSTTSTSTTTSTTMAPSTTTSSTVSSTTTTPPSTTTSTPPNCKPEHVKKRHPKKPHRPVRRRKHRGGTYHAASPHHRRYPTTTTTMRCAPVPSTTTTTVPRTPPTVGLKCKHGYGYNAAKHACRRKPTVVGAFKQHLISTTRTVSGNGPFAALVAGMIALVMLTLRRRDRRERTA